MKGCITGLRLFETMAAVPAEMNARMPMIGAAACNARTGDWTELYKMAAEKAEAFTQAALSIARDMQAIHGEMMKPTRSAKSAGPRPYGCDTTQSGMLGGRLHQYMPPRLETGGDYELRARTILCYSGSDYLTKRRHSRRIGRSPNTYIGSGFEEAQGRVSWRPG